MGEGKIRIVVLQRGWCVVGRVSDVSTAGFRKDVIEIAIEDLDLEVSSVFPLLAE